jgi:hypothetical protein
MSDLTLIGTTIDPAGCNCDDCLRGSSIPLHRATAVHLHGLMNGDLANATGLDLSDIEAVLDGL